MGQSQKKNFFKKNFKSKFFKNFLFSIRFMTFLVILRKKSFFPNCMPKVVHVAVNPKKWEKMEFLTIYIKKELNFTQLFIYNDFWYLSPFQRYKGSKSKFQKTWKEGIFHFFPFFPRILPKPKNRLAYSTHTHFSYLAHVQHFCGSPTV